MDYAFGSRSFRDRIAKTRWPENHRFFQRELSKPANISLSAETLQRYAGVYGMAPGINMIVTVEDGQLVSQMTHQQKLPLTALSANIFMPKVVDAQLEFPKDEQVPPLNWSCTRMDAI